MHHAPTPPYDLASAHDDSTTDISATLYRAAIGTRGQARYLARFQAFDAQGRYRAGWHWPAFGSALNWLIYRGHWRAAAVWCCVAALGSLVVLGGARLVFDASAWQLGAVLALLVAAWSVVWGLWADALFHRLCNRRILHAVSTSDHLAEACARLAQQAGAPGHRVGMAMISTACGAALLASTCAFQTRVDTPASPTLVAAAPALPTVQEPGPTTVVQGAGPSESAHASDPCQGCTPSPATPTPDGPQDPQQLPAALAAQPPAPPSGAGHFAVQVGVFAVGDNAARLTHTLRAHGLAVYVEQIGPQMQQQRVRIGPFKDKEQAQRAAKRVHALKMPAIIVRLP